VSGKCHTPVKLYSQYPLDRRLGGPQEPVWTQRLEEKSFAPARYQTLVVQSVVRLTELPWLIFITVNLLIMAAVLFD
jgi:hypothetical protein